MRILGEGQFRVDADAAARLTALDKDLDAAVDTGEAAANKTALNAAIGIVRRGTHVGDDEFVTAEYILPFSDAGVGEVRKLLADGMIPGDSIGLP